MSNLFSQISIFSSPLVKNGAAHVALWDMGIGYYIG
jgi:hypothetical protein